MMSSTLSGQVIPASAGDLIEDQDAARAYLFEALPFDPAAGAETTVRAAVGLPHSVLDSQYWPAILRSAVDSNVDLYGDRESEQGRSNAWASFAKASEPVYPGASATQTFRRPSELMMAPPLGNSPPRGVQ